MREHKATCDHCGKSVKAEGRSFMGSEPNWLSLDGFTIALAAPQFAHHSTKYYRDFCDEFCLRDYLIAKLPATKPA